MSMFKKDGVGLIDSMVDKAQDIIDTLKQGIELCGKQQAENVKVIEEKQTENVKLGKKMAQGEKFAKALSEMITPDENVQPTVAQVEAIEKTETETKTDENAQ